MIGSPQSQPERKITMATHQTGEREYPPEQSEKPTFSLDFKGGYGEAFPLAKLAEVLVGTEWEWVRNNRAKHLVVFIDTRGERMCRVYDRDEHAMTLAELQRQHGLRTGAGDDYRDCNSDHAV